MKCFSIGDGWADLSVGMDGQGQVQDNWPDWAVQLTRQQKQSSCSSGRKTWTPRTAELTCSNRSDRKLSGHFRVPEDSFSIYPILIFLWRNIYFIQTNNSTVKSKKQQPTLLSNAKVATQFILLKFFM